MSFATVNFRPDAEEVTIVALHSGRQHLLDRWMQAAIELEVPENVKVTLLLVDTAPVALDYRSVLAEFVGKLPQYYQVSLIRVASPDTNDLGMYEKHDRIRVIFEQVFLNIRTEFVLTWDDDVIPPANALVSVWAGMCGVDIGVSGAAVANASSPTKVCAARNSDQWGDVPVFSELSSTPEHVGFIGAGFTMYRRRFLNHLRVGRNWTYGFLAWDGHVCQVARDSGQHVLLCGSVVCDHDFKPNLTLSRQANLRPTDKDLWVSGVITAPRPTETLENTLTSLRLGGFNPHIFAEPNSKVSQAELGNVHWNESRLGCGRNGYSALKAMLDAGDESEVVVLFEDDIAVPTNLAGWLAHHQPLNWKVLSLFTPRSEQTENVGWCVSYSGRYRTYGALAFAFTREALRVFLADKFVQNMVAEGLGMDEIVGAWTERIGSGLFYHSPSLVKHSSSPSSLRTWDLGPLVDVEIPVKMNGAAVAAIPLPKAQVGLVGWNTAQGLGYLNRDLMDNLSLNRWIIPDHPLFPQLDWKAAWKDRLLFCEVSESIPRMRELCKDLDWLLFCELPYLKNFAGVAKECGVQVACVPMWEWLAEDLDWLRFVDLFLCPNRKSYELLSEWKAKRDYNWELKLVPWPIDPESFMFRKRETFNTVLFINGTGGGRGKLGHKRWTGPRKGLDLVQIVAGRCPTVPFLIRSQEDLSDMTFSDNVEVLGATEDVNELYCEGDVLLWPSRYEGLGMQALEAQACGMPIIATDGAPMNEYNPAWVINSEPISISVYANNEVAAFEPTVDAIVTIINNNVGLPIGEQSEQARRFIVKEHSWVARKSLLESTLRL